MEFPDIFAPRDKRPENGNYVIDEGFTVDGFDIEYREFRDIGMMMKNVRHGVDFLATDISIPAGGEKAVSIESMRRLRYTEVGGTYRLIIMPAPTDGMEYNSFDIEFRNTSEKNFIITILIWKFPVMWARHPSTRTETTILSCFVIKRHKTAK